MKIKTTRKAIVASGGNIKCAGYCDLQCLLINHEPDAYTCGVYGWNYDVYTVYAVTICTGYRSQPGERLQHIAEYEQRAREILRDCGRSFEEQRTAVEALLKEFCERNGGKA